MSSTAPATNPPTATIMYGTWNHVGRGWARTPMGLAEVAKASLLAARSTPKMMRMTGATLAPNTVHPTTARELDDLGRYRLESAAAVTQPSPRPAMLRE